MTLGKFWDVTVPQKEHSTSGSLANIIATIAAVQCIWCRLYPELRLKLIHLQINTRTFKTGRRD